MRTGKRSEIFQKSPRLLILKQCRMKQLWLQEQVESTREDTTGDTGTPCTGMYLTPILQLLH